MLKDRYVLDPWYQELVNIYCPAQKESARLCYDRLSRPNPLIKFCDDAFSEPCPYEIIVRNVKFVDQSLCISQGVSADVCAELGMGLAYTFKGSACVGVDYGQKECATHGSEGSKSEKQKFFIEPGHKLCLMNIGVSCVDDAHFQGYTHVEQVLAQEPCPFGLAKNLPSCYVDIVVEEEEEDCHIIPKESDCFILETNDRTATLYCEGDCKTNELQKALAAMLNSAFERVDRIVNQLGILERLEVIVPFFGRGSGNTNDRNDNALVPSDWDISNCDWKAQVSLGYNYHPVEGWVDPSGYNIEEDTYHPGVAVHYCVEQSVEQSGAPSLTSKWSLILAWAGLGFVLFYG